MKNRSQSPKSRIPFRQMRAKSFRQSARALWKRVLELKDEKSTTTVAKSFAGLGITVRHDNVLEFQDIAVPKSRNAKQTLARKLKNIRDNFQHHRKLVLKDREPKAAPQAQTARRMLAPQRPATSKPGYTPPPPKRKTDDSQPSA